MSASEAARCRIAYLQHVDWRWIRQRPQFLAEKLGERHDVRVFFRVHPHRRRFSPNLATSVHATPLLPLPTGVGRPWEGPAASLQRVWLNWQLRAERPDLVWLTFPTLLGSVPRAWRDVPLVYDCMDDALGFAGSPRRRARLSELEGALVRRAARVLCSSAHLRDKLQRRWSDVPPERFVLLRNGLADHLVERYRDRQPRDEPPGDVGRTSIRLAYVGTIAEWLDTDLLIRSLNDVPDLEIDLYGPTEAAAVRHERLRYKGILPHDQLRATAARYDGLIMPFRVTELIRSVDPVKLYEYLSFGRPVIAVGYDEVARFAPYVHLYQDADEFIAFVRQLRDDSLPKRSNPAAVLEFLERNTWGERARELVAALTDVVPRCAPSAGPSQPLTASGRATA